VTDRGELLSIIVPVFNEAGTVRQVLERLLEVRFTVAREVLVVDDGSTDGTRQVLQAALDAGLGIDVIEATRNGGRGSAIRLGLTQARGTILAMHGADVELDPQQLTALVAPILSGESTVVYGSRFLTPPRAPRRTDLANRVLTAVTNFLFATSLTDMGTCYKVMRLDVARSLKLTADRIDIEPQITARLLRRGHTIRELPLRFDPRSRVPGKSSGWRDGVRALHVLISERFRAG
jgi:glycosyltransferase involved in cell wall biosynthesis